MSDGSIGGLTDRSKTLSFRYDGNARGFVEDSNRSKQKRSTTMDLIKNKSPYIGGFMYYN